MTQKEEKEDYISIPISLKEFTNFSVKKNKTDGLWYGYIGGYIVNGAYTEKQACLDAVVDYLMDNYPDWCYA